MKKEQKQINDNVENFDSTSTSTTTSNVRVLILIDYKDSTTGRTSTSKVY